jgi:hypothetical protein
VCAPRPNACLWRFYPSQGLPTEKKKGYEQTPARQRLNQLRVISTHTQCSLRMILRTVPRPQYTYSPSHTVHTKPRDALHAANMTLRTQLILKDSSSKHSILLRVFIPYQLPTTAVTITAIAIIDAPPIPPPPPPALANRDP